MTTTPDTTDPAPAATSTDAAGAPTGPTAPTAPDDAITRPGPVGATTRTVHPGEDELLASDSEREHVTDRLRQAAAEGRLTLDEADERQAAAYAARTRAELVPLLSGLPAVPRARRPRRGPLTPRARRNLVVHAGVTAAILLVLMVAAIVGPAPFFVPIGPAFWLGLILFVHSRRAEREPSPDEQIPAELR
ncbi:DUF1707 SHOCT-like domain-containing protein [Pseudonocardia sp. HH130630-07]|uniref:DUF1707 SHOCT-like domain-containing protein n=1 Tax=Pseudonocardia sp. HH130630-07 TaxID=1690815 RepID=UPI000815080D|nr:DUF1707 domain-containing protein [Pseudonocardia sp. HH130630-07]ANY06980.1 hypothetical protein AFB00_12515 [Pseudonocardia sp. HH130630-07]